MPRNYELICPVTGKLCEVPSSCAAMKENIDEGGLHPESVMAHDYAVLGVPKGIQEALWSSHCYEERHSAVTEYLNSGQSDATAAIDVLAGLERAKRIITGQEQPAA